MAILLDGPHAIAKHLNEQEINTVAEYVTTLKEAE
jgi:cytochrome c553